MVLPGVSLVACVPFLRPVPTRQSDRLAPAAAPAADSGAAASGVIATPPVLTPAPGAGGQASLIGDPTRGRHLFVTAGCAGCHTIEGVPGASGATGPNLTNVTLRPTLAGETIPTSPATLVRWLLDPQSVKPGAAMPSVGLTTQQAQDLAAFLYSQPYNRLP